MHEEHARSKKKAMEYVVPGPDHARRIADLRRLTLPNEMEVAYQSKAEVPYFYEDIFVKQIYLKHGITLRDGDCVFDVGANIGFFTLFANRHARGVKVFAFEPSPPVFEILLVNTSLHGVDAKLFNCGLSDETKPANFTFYPNSSGMSSFYADIEEEKEALRVIMQNQLRQGMAGMELVMRHVDEILEERFKSITFECHQRTVSEIIHEHRVERVDLMKVDVQKSELDILAGIWDVDWPKIRQMVIEVHDFEGRLWRVGNLLEERGYVVTVEQDEHYEGSKLYNLFAVRPATASDLFRAGAGERRARPVSADQIRDRARKQEEARHLIKQRMEQRNKNR